MEKICFLWKASLICASSELALTKKCRLRFHWWRSRLESIGESSIHHCIYYWPIHTWNSTSRTSWSNSRHEWWGQQWPGNYLISGEVEISGILRLEKEDITTNFTNLMLWCGKETFRAPKTKTVANRLKLQGQHLCQCTQFLSNILMCSQTEQMPCEGVGSWLLKSSSSSWILPWGGEGN